MKNKVTVFTPAYNRGYVIQACYDSLCAQTNQNFCWLIVDDGSIDNTEELITSFINENKIQITYLKQKNRGKHIAHNTGVLNCKTEIFVCVDSDDYLASNAIQKIYDSWNEISNSENLAGIVALRGEDAKTPLGTWMPTGIAVTSIASLYEKHKFKGDTMLVFKTSILKKYLFPEFHNEKFVTEAVIYDLISQHYNMKLINEILYLCRYLDDGYTRNISSVHKANPKGYMHYLKQKIELANGFRNKFRAVSYYIAGCLLLRDIKYYKICQHNFMKVMALPNATWIFLKPNIKNYLIKSRIFRI